MKEFPELKENEVALLRAEKTTGHVLDDQFNIAINDKQNVFTVFESVEEALVFSKKTLMERDNVEIVIYGPEKLVLHYIS